MAGNEKKTSWQEWWNALPTWKQATLWCFALPTSLICLIFLWLVSDFLDFASLWKARYNLAIMVAGTYASFIAYFLWDWRQKRVREDGGNIPEEKKKGGAGG